MIDDDMYDRLSIKHMWHGITEGVPAIKNISAKLFEKQLNALAALGNNQKFRKTTFESRKSLPSNDPYLFITFLPSQPAMLS